MTTRPGPSSCYPVAVHNELMSLMLRMVEMYPGLPAGSVMRSVARTVRRARVAGVELEALPVRAEHTAHEVLAARLAATGPGAHGDHQDRATGGR